MTRRANRKTRGPGRRLLEIGKDLLIAALVLVNLTLAIMCLPSKTLTQTKWLAGRAHLYRARDRQHDRRRGAAAHHHPFDRGRAAERAV